jgi:hypothetical protein
MRRHVFLALLAAMLLPATIVKAETAAEKQMAQRIGSQLKQSGKLRDYRIGVKYQKGVAYLNGTVTDAHQREAATRMAGSIKGVSRVVNKLELASNSAQPRTGDRGRLSDALDRATQASAQGEANTAMQAYGQANQAQGIPPRPVMSPGSIRMMNPAPMPRSNMPVPAGRMMPVRPAGAVMPAAGACPGGCQTGPGAGGGMAMGMGGMGGSMGMSGGADAVPVGFVPHGAGRGPSYENAQMPGYAWPSYAAYPNYAALSYPRQYSPTAWPYIGPFYPYPQVPLAWRKVSLEWDDGWWFLDFSSHNSSH